jgi:hypothetical protein
VKVKSHPMFLFEPPAQLLELLKGKVGFSFEQ